MARQLEQLNQEIAALKAEIKAAREAYRSETDGEKRADLKGEWEQLQKEKEALLADRRALQAKLPGPGVLTSLSSAHRMHVQYTEITAHSGGVWPWIQVIGCKHLLIFWSRLQCCKGSYG